MQMVQHGKQVMGSSGDSSRDTLCDPGEFMVREMTALTLATGLRMSLEPLLQRYETWDIYHADETSLFFKSLSDRTMSFDHEQPTGSKLTSSKDHLSLMLCANMTGTDKQKPVLVGKAANPACLKKKGLSIANLGVDYYHNAKGWMTAAVFDL